MAFRFSTKVRDDMLGYKARCNLLMTATDISFVDGAAANDSIEQVAAGLAGFEAGDMITVEGSTSNDGTYELLAVSAAAVEVGTGLLTAEIAGDQVILGSARGGSLVDQFRNGTMVIRTASQPTSADDAETGSELIQITQSSGAFVADSPENGINFGQIADGELHAALGEVWSGAAGATGTAGHFRVYANDMTTGASTTKARIDGAIATSGSQMNMANTAITSGGTTTIDDVDIPMAESV
jgi:hypothetical protein